MARTIRFHLDECCDPAIANGLRRRKIDVTISQEAGLIEAEDEQQAAYGLSEYRAVFTHDADFLRSTPQACRMRVLSTEPRIHSAWVK